MNKLLPCFCLMLITLTSCMSTSGEKVSGLYVNNETGGYVIIKDSGEFYYALEPKDKEQYKTDKLPSNLGHYTVRKDGSVLFILRSAHVGVIDFDLSGGRNNLYVTRPNSSGVRKKEVFVKIGAVGSQHSTLTTNPPPRGAEGSGGSED